MPRGRKKKDTTPSRLVSARIPQEAYDIYKKHGTNMNAIIREAVILHQKTLQSVDPMFNRANEILHSNHEITKEEFNELHAIYLKLTDILGQPPRLVIQRKTAA